MQRRPGARRRLFGLDDDALFNQAVRQPFVLRRRVGGEGLVGLEDPGDLVARDRDARDLAWLHLRHEVAEAHGLVARLEPWWRTFHTRTPTTTSTIQNSRLFSVEFTRGLRPGHCQDYHGLRIGRDARSSSSANPGTQTTGPVHRPRAAGGGGSGAAPSHRQRRPGASFGRPIQAAASSRPDASSAPRGLVSSRSDRCAPSASARRASTAARSRVSHLGRNRPLGPRDHNHALEPAGRSDNRPRRRGRSGPLTKTPFGPIRSARTRPPTSTDETSPVTSSLRRSTSANPGCTAPASRRACSSTRRCSASGASARAVAVNHQSGRVSLHELSERRSRSANPATQPRRARFRRNGRAPLSRPSPSRRAALAARGGGSDSGHGDVSVGRVFDPAIAVAAQPLRSSSRPTSRSGRTNGPRAGWMPPSPRAPAPRNSLSSTVSAWSSRVCATATQSAPSATRARSNAAYRARRAASSGDTPRGLSMCDALDRRCQAELARECAAECLVLVRGSAAQLMIYVRQAGERHAELTLQLVQETDERHRVRAAGHGSDDSRSAGQQPKAPDGAGKTFPDRHVRTERTGVACGGAARWGLARAPPENGAGAGT